MGDRHGDFDGSQLLFGQVTPEHGNMVLKESLRFHMQNIFVQIRHQSIAMLIGVPLALNVTMGSLGLAEEPQVLSEENAAERAKGAWESGAINPALDILDQGIEDNPHALALYKLRGDILSTSRGPQEAVQAYDIVLATQPTSLDVRWAKWSVLIRWGKGEESIDELRRIAQIDDRNPLIHLRLAQELRKLNRLEESLESFKKAVELVPDLLGWRLAMARTRFDLLDYEGADGDVDYVLQKLPPDSPLASQAETLRSVIHGTSQDRGRRFEPVFSQEGVTPAQLKEWAFIRADAWRLFVAGRYQEAEPVYRKLLALNPKDPNATHQFGLTLMHVGKCKEALTIFGKMSDLDPTDELYADTVFRMGQCLVELEQWEEAFVHFQILYNEAVEFEERNKNVQLPPGTRVLDKKKLARWLEKVRPHVPELANQKADKAADSNPSGDPPRSTGITEKEYAEVIERVKPQNLLDTGSLLMGRDADFNWFRFVIPASKVMRDDFPTGDHQFIPVNPGDSFPTTQQDIFLVFGLVSASYDAVPLSAQCFLETSEMTENSDALTQDQVMMSMNDQSAYFRLSPPQTGWTPGLYRCVLFAGERASADTQVDEVRFRIIQPTRSSQQSS
jgi:tetratricopeptide (TPR) repeat protein